MNTTTALILMALVAGTPILLILLFVTRQMWKAFNMKSMLAGGLMALGGIFLFTCLITVLDTQMPSKFLTEPFLPVQGTVEDIDYSISKHGSMGSYTVKVNGGWYTLTAFGPYYESFSDFVPGQWICEAIGQNVEVEIYSRNRFANWSATTYTWHIIRGEIYGITDAEGNVLLDSEAYRQAVCLTIEENDEIMPYFIAAGVLLIALGLFIKFKLKW